MSHIKYKDVKSDLADISGRTVKMVWSVMDVKDLDNDVITSGAFTKTIQERGHAGKDLIYSLIDHKASIMTMYGKPKELYIEGQKLVAVTDIVKTALGEDMIKKYEAGLINQHSIGFTIPTNKSFERDGYTEITEVKLYEGSAVLWGANPDTPTIGIKSFTKETAVERLDNLQDTLSGLYKSIKTKDEGFGLADFAIEQVISEIKVIKEFISNTHPQKSNEPLIVEPPRIDYLKIINSL